MKLLNNWLPKSKIVFFEMDSKHNMKKICIAGSGGMLGEGFYQVFKDGIYRQRCK